ncbi:tyrosine-protein phosphatase [Bdellovibrio bacteriovorus]|uniref:tyrosine-protein phosphatase n=1 Tax=Bdellovibrio bacteriovorus TaxID=959 RepID=UPI0035A5E1F9
MNLVGGINFRDMGGYLNQDGRRVKMRKFFRSGSLSKLTAEDCKRLEDISVTHILDYRDHKESENDKDVLWSGVHYECCPANPDSHQVSAAVHDFFSNERLEVLPHDFMEDLYRQLPFANPAYRALFHKMENLQDGGLVQHCAVGKDRTGVGSALLLLSLGVSKDTVVQDYLVTEKTLKPFKDQLVEKIGAHLSSKAHAKLEYMMAANENFLQSAFNAMEKKYGTIEKFLEMEYALTQERRAILQARFLE